jgi:integrase
MIVRRNLTTMSLNVSHARHCRADRIAAVTHHDGTARLHMHALRHLFASMALDHGMDIYTLADRPGHSDPAFTLRKYVRRVPNAGAKLRAALRNIYEQSA